MMLKPQKRSQRKPYVIALHSPLSRLASLNAAKLLYASMILLDHLAHLRILQSLKLAHLQLVCRPVFNAAVFGNHLEYPNQSVGFEVNYAPWLCYLNLAQLPVTAAVWINLAIAFELSQPNPTKTSNGFQVVEARIPAIKQHTFRRKPAFPGFGQHLAEMVIFSCAVGGLIKQAVVAGYVSLTVSPKQSDEIYSHNDLSMFARPVAGNKVNLSGVLLIERGVVENEYARIQFNLVTSLLPEVLAVCLKTRQQAINRIVSGRVVSFWLRTGCFCAAIDLRSGNQKIDVVIFVALWRIHS
jgi:hypothetical protein